MKILWNLLLIGICFTFSSCSKDKVDMNVNSLSWYWDSRNYSPDRKELVFEFYTELGDNHYNLHFNHSINQNEILIELKDIKFDKECSDPTHPEYNCSSSGGFTIPEVSISNGDYSFIVSTPNFEIESQFIVQDSAFILNIPENDNFTSYKSIEQSVWWKI